MPLARAGERSVAKDWDQHYRALGQIQAAFVVQAYAPFLPSGMVLDLAGGAGRNAFYLASRGHPVIVLEKNPIALEQVRSQAEAGKLPVWGVQMDLESQPISLPPGPFAGILISYYVNRELLAKLAERLAPSGLLLIEGFTTLEAQQRSSKSPWYWRPGELLAPPAGLELRAFGEGWIEQRHRTWAVWQRIHLG
jgi:SAM-dependent methyltransferase